MTYRVQIDDNFHYQDEEHRVTGPEFVTFEEAVAYCRKIVDEFLVSAHQPGMKPEELYSAYTTFGEDPYIVTEDRAGRFSAWDYAKERARAICAG